MRDMKQISAKNREYMEKHNPCYKEEALTRNCLDKNNYVQEKCTDYFANVKFCKVFWQTIKTERRIRGIKPYLPLPHERAEIKEEYLKNKKYPDVEKK